MTVYYDHSRTYATARLHPYTAAQPGESGYVDFKADPQLIPEVLEDFRPFADRPAIQTFYSFLRWINGPSSHLESSDCALRPPGPHQDGNSTLPLCIYGRLCLQFRDPFLNSSLPKVARLSARIMECLHATDAGLSEEAGVVGVTRVPILQLAISKGTWQPDESFKAQLDDPGRGEQLMLSFWAYGKDDDEAFASLERVFTNIWTACRSLVGEDLSSTQ